MHIRQAEIAPLKTKRQLCVIDPQAVQQRCVEIVNRQRIFRDVVAVVMGGAVAEAWLHSAARC